MKTRASRRFIFSIIPVFVYIFFSSLSENDGGVRDILLKDQEYGQEYREDDTVFGKEIHESKSNRVRDAYTRKVILYPQENRESNQRIERNGLLVVYPRARATIVICHGFMCDMIDAGFLRTLFKRGDYNFLTFNFRAHGQIDSDQQCTFGRDEALDVCAAAQFIRSHPELSKMPLFGYGFSMGAVALIEAQAQNASHFDALILDCPFGSSETVLKNSIDRMKFSLCGYEFDIPGKYILQKYAFHPYMQAFLKLLLKTVLHLEAKNISLNMCPFCPSESIKNVYIPCFFIHCRNDEKVPLDSVKMVFDEAQGYKELWFTNGRRHFDSFFYNPEEYIYRLNKFFNAVLEGSHMYKAAKQKVKEDSSEISY